MFAYLKKILCGCAVSALAGALYAAPAVTVERNGDHDGRPLLSWDDDTEAVTVQRLKAGDAVWADLAEVAAGTSSYLDDTALYSVAYSYRLKGADESIGAESAGFKVMRYFQVWQTGATIFSDGDFSNQGWALVNGTAAWLAFDYPSGNYLDPGRFPDCTTSNGGPYKPKMGVDFGAASNHVAEVRLMPRSADTLEHRINGVSFYGTQTDGATEIALGNENNGGTRLNTTEISGVEDGSGAVWHSFTTDSSVAYRSYYLCNVSGGNIVEAELWGWTEEDLVRATRIEATVSVERTDYVDSYAVVACNDVPDGSDVQRRIGETGAWEVVGQLAANAFTDEYVPYGSTVYYRVATAQGESDAVAFVRMRRLAVAAEQVWWQSNGAESWEQPGTKAFDGDTSTYADVNASAGKIGVDFGGTKYVVAKMRVYPRTPQCAHRLGGAVLYGSRKGGESEVSTADVGTALSGALVVNSHEEDSTTVYDWTEVGVANPGIYRCYYLYKENDFYGNVGEIEFYGWTLDDVENPPLDFSVTRTDFDTFYPFVSWNDVAEGPVTVQRGDGPTGPWANAAVVAVGEETSFVDHEARYGVQYYYRLSYDGVSTDPIPFRRLRKLTASMGTVFTNWDTEYTDGVDNSPGTAFDGSINTYVDGGRNDGVYPKIGIDFGAGAKIALALVRFYPRNEWGGNNHLSSGAVVYGSALSAEEESATTVNGTALTGASSFADYTPEWHEYESLDNTRYFRTFYYQGNYTGSMAEAEFYGWYESDVSRPFMLYLR